MISSFAGLMPEVETEPSGRSPAVGRLLWEQEVGSSILPAPTRYKLGVATGGPI